MGLKRLFRGAELNPVNGVPPALLGHSNIRVDNTTIENAKYFGIYVGQNSNAIAITKTKITHSFGGIYLEAGTSNSLISEVEIRNSFDREAIAVDASHHNIIEKSIFSGNPGGIKLYKNCGETTGSVCPILREQGSNFNTIRGNTFEGDSLQIASRQFIYYGFGWCEGTSGRGGIWNDVAESNTVSDNTFNNTLFEVRHTPVFIRGNRFNSTRVSLGTPAPPRETEIRMTGEMTGNILGPGSSVVLNQSSSYFSGFKIESNRTDTGACAPFNSCP